MVTMCTLEPYCVCIWLKNETNISTKSISTDKKKKKTLKLRHVEKLTVTLRRFLKSTSFWSSDPVITGTFPGHSRWFVNFSPRCKSEMGVGGGGTRRNTRAFLLLLLLLGHIYCFKAKQLFWATHLHIFLLKKKKKNESKCTQNMLNCVFLKLVPK